MREPDRKLRDGRKVAVLAVLLGFGALGAPAQQKVFNPSISVGAFSTDNVRYLGEGEGFDDVGYQVGIDLPIRRTLKNGTFTFRQSVSAWRHDEFEAADSETYQTTLGWTTRPSRTSSVRIQGRYVKSQDPGGIDSFDEAELFLQQRLDRESLSANLSYSKRLRNRWGWTASGGASVWSFEAVRGFDNDPLAVAVEDRTAARGALGLTRAVSRTSTIGLRYGYQRFDLDFSGDEDSHSVSFTWNKQIEERLSVNFAIGGFESSGVAAEGPQGPEDASRTGVQASLGVSKSWRYRSLSLTVSHSPSAGGARLGTSTDTAAGLTLSGNRPASSWRWGFSLRYARRDPSAPAASEIHSVGVAARIERQFWRSVGLRLNAAYFDQSGDRARDEALYLSPGFNLVWYPRGHRSGGFG